METDQSRDFTFIGDVVDANLAAAMAPADVAAARPTTSRGEPHTLLRAPRGAWPTSRRRIPSGRRETRALGDVRDSWRHHRRRRDLGYHPTVTFETACPTVECLLKPRSRAERPLLAIDHPPDRASRAVFAAAANFRPRNASSMALARADGSDGWHEQPVEPRSPLDVAVDARRDDGSPVASFQRAPRHALGTEEQRERVHGAEDMRQDLVDCL